ncbi:Hint domain-containing protein [Ameyamaea chiangmaiensis]|uniref:Hint domain-containing protein n=1 Tax=Ameyamaea chiangmaiensis TaxID=442969 RepID=A0A850P5Q9_9PROT|nr:Hint domain-containing protein [Ameyamaea chiangmaiensis]MBS4074221.1 Hint domain-containing protein [Ameyamaea chiangmaiensis]NVN39164.1 Hint domain-containing protein [Ameyamaea chiangmaiensis]
MSNGTWDFDTTVTPATCFLSGTRIRTARGEVAVEDIRVGDQLAVLDACDAFRPVVWVGQRMVRSNPRKPLTEAGYPVRILADAFGDARGREGAGRIRACCGDSRSGSGRDHAGGHRASFGARARWVRGLRAACWYGQRCSALAHARPADVVGPFCDDRRALCVLVGAVRVWEQEAMHVVDAHCTQADLAGWHGVEAAPMRWTAGRAVLPLGRAFDTDGMLSIEIVTAGPYCADEDETGAEARAS